MKASPPLPAGPGRDEGYSLVEFLVAVTLFSLAAALSGAALVQAQRASVRAREIERALAFATNILESLRAFGTAGPIPAPSGLRLCSNWGSVPEHEDLFEASVEVESDLWGGEPISLHTLVWRRERP